MIVGVDIGGTFTDFVVSEQGRLRVHKRLSTPDDPSRAMLAGLESVSAGDSAAITRIIHGSTVATNAILERKGGKTALITTQGFRDLLAIGRQNRPDLYALQPRLPPPLIPRDLCFEVPERLDYSGAVLTALDVAAVDAVLGGLAERGVESVAVCLLYSYVNPAHEQAVRSRAVERGLFEPGQVVLSSDVLPEFREYERASTAALEAYVRPVMSRYLARLEAALPPGPALRVMKSDGGIIRARTARAQAIQTALSGPAAGVIGAHYLARLAGFDDVLTLDMGGTSTDVALCAGGPTLRPESEIDGLPLRIRLLDIETVGAGGGSIARVDAGGALRVGPESAGADPGPVAYGRGGSCVTVTDANVVLGRIESDHFLGGDMRLDVDAARNGLATLAGELGVDAETAARGVVEVANSNIDRALRRVSIARGYDPRDFTLMAFGGAGPLHACEVAERLQMTRVLVPPHPGVLCAFGLLVANTELDYARGVLGPLTPETPAQLHAILDGLLSQAAADLEAEGVPESTRAFAASVDMRYRGQAHELTVPFGPDLAAAFHDAHTQSYGYAMPSRPIEVVTVRLRAAGTTEKPPLAAEPLRDEDASPALLARRRDGVALYARDRLHPGARLSGPALVFQLDSTIYIAEGWNGRVDGWRNLILEQE